MPTIVDSFSTVKNYFKIKSTDACTIDNPIFKLNYRITVGIFLIATILVTSQQYIGEHIKCINDKGVDEKVMNTFCFFTSTFTVVKHMDDKLLDSGYIAHPGVGPYGLKSEEPIKRHAYYQWVPFVLFGQALMFYLPHFIWKKYEGGRLNYLVKGMHLALDPRIYEGKIDPIVNVFISQLRITTTWTVKLIFCETLNLLNLFLQIYIIQSFLGGEFLGMGIHILREGVDSEVDILDKVFPKVTKCTFHKYGASGSMQSHDAMCVMALNVINEKIYAFLWFWFIFLFVANVFALLWRVISAVLHAKSPKFNRFLFSGSLHMYKRMSNSEIAAITQNTSYSDWVFLKYIYKNMDPIVFATLFKRLAEDLDARKSDKFNSEDSDDEESKSFSPSIEKFD